jgi:DNA-binding NarL/FixJ family response regulator
MLKWRRIKMKNVENSILKGLLAVFTLALTNDHMLGADQSNKILLIGVLTILTLVFTPDQLINTIKEVASGSSAIKSGLLNESIFAENILKLIPIESSIKASQLTKPPLTPREREVLSLMADGLMNKEIASKIGLHEGTVKCHVNSIFHKLNANVRTEAVILGIKNGLIDIPNFKNV